MRRVIIDSDTAGDDTTAILMALKHFKVEGITIVAGNVAFDQEVDNALTTIETFNPDYKVPVYKGYQSPMIALPNEVHDTVEEIQGGNGMGDAVFPKPQQKPEEQHAIDFIIETVKANPGEIELIALAPLTNIAMAIKKAPEIAKDIKHIWIMGGVNNRLGNMNVSAEYNFYVDPEAARIVLNASTEKTMVTWDASLDFGVIYEEDIEEIQAIQTKGSKFFLDINMFVRAFELAKRGIDGITCTDSLLTAVAALPELTLQATNYYVDVETQGQFARGYNIVDWEEEFKRTPNCRVIERIDSQAFKNALKDLLAGMR
ncbi:nucleoside hydrolase [Aerococcus sp. 1KP-2016]|uniref:nucleoside hydrolase n=1 Tax=Aerococcus sp. 1KP-2016 TaxID=1981982 RepID=UPI000B995295|nr:nucleoside hydrolase [Aerococcus sp. 1KP-2016]OYQ68154.1 ribosylpyrimidine nucleosidase [Aerococcus sp. 1KP-2016]